MPHQKQMRKETLKRNSYYREITNKGYPEPMIIYCKVVSLFQKIFNIKDFYKSINGREG